MKNILIISALALGIFSCAGPYRALNPALLPFSNSQVTEPLEISYIYDVQRLTRNKRYANKEGKNFMRLVGIKVRNLSDRPITLTKENFSTYVNETKTTYVAPSIYGSQVKQTEGFYLLHTLWGIGYSRTEFPNGQVEDEWQINPLIILGPYNFGRALGANAKHERTLEETSIFGKEIKPKETLFGTVILQINTFETLDFRYRQ